MKTLSTLLVAGSALAISAPAMAQDATDGTFTGPRVEALVGYDISKAGDTVDDDLNENNDQSIDGVGDWGGAPIRSEYPWLSSRR